MQMYVVLHYQSDTWKNRSSNLKRSRDMILKPGVCCEKYFSQKYDSIVALRTSPMFSNRPTNALIFSLEVGCHFLALENAFIVSWCSDIYLSAHRFVSDTKTSNRSLPSAVWRLRRAAPFLSVPATKVPPPQRQVSDLRGPR